MSTTQQSPPLSPDDSPEAAAYRPVCGLAIVALVLGLASALAIIGPGFWMLPLLTLGVGALALRRIASHDPPLMGRRLALAAIFLAVAWGATGISRSLAYNWIAERQARQVAELWIAHMLAGETCHAHQLTVEPRFRELRLDELTTVYDQNPELNEQLALFLELPAAMLALRFGSDARVEFERVLQQASDRDANYYWLAYRLASAGNAARSAEIVICAKRNNTDPPGWMVFEAIPASVFEQRAAKR